MKANGEKISKLRRKKRESVKNAMRSALVVIGPVAFGYLTLQLAFKPYLENTQQQQQQHLQSLQDQQKSSSDSHDQFDDSHILISDEGFSNPDDS